MIDEINKAVDTLKKGGTILYPTDTIWGIGCDATNETAIEKIINIKGRQLHNGFIVLLDNENYLSRYVKEIPDIAWELLDASDEPLTIIYPNGLNLAKNLLAEDKSIAIRIVKDEFCKKLINKFGKPIVSTSANLHKAKAPDCFDDIDEIITSKVDYTVDYRQECLMNIKPSSIIKLEVNGSFKIIRE